MRNFISVISLGVALCAVSGSADATPTCALDGTFATSSQRGPVTMTTKLVAATHTIALHRSGGGLPDADVTGTYTYDPATSKIVLTNTQVSTQDMAFYACLNVPGTYTVQFPDCGHMTLALVRDTCGPRSQSAPHATFTKQ